MKKIILLFIIGLLCNLNKVYAQIQVKELKLDSLERANERYQKQDLTKLKLLNALAYEYPTENPTKGIEIGEQAITLAQKFPDKSGQLLLAEAYNNKGLNHVIKSEYPAAMELYQKALGINQSLKNKYGVAHNTANMGRLFHLTGESKKANEYYEQALSIFEAIPDKAGIAKCYNGIGGVYENLSDNSKALEYFQRALAINEQLGNRNEIAINLYNTGVVYKNLYDYAKALEYYLKALVINQQLGNKSRMASSLSGIGSIHENLYDYPKALEYYQKALAINEQLGNKSRIAINLSRIGSIHENLYDYPKALEYYQKALAINEQLGKKSGLAINLSSIGGVYSHLSNYPKALEYYLKALAIHEQTGNKKGMANNLMDIALVYQNLYDYPKALDYLQKSLQISEQIGNKRVMAVNLNDIGLVYYSLLDYPKALEYYQKSMAINEQIGDKGLIAVNLANIGLVYSCLFEYPKAIDYYQRAITINEQIGDKIYMANDLINFGTIYLDAPDTVLTKLGIAPSQRYEKALEYLNKSLKMAQEIEAVVIQKNAWYKLSTTYEKQGEFAKAHEAYKTYIVLRDSIESGEIKNRIERKTMQYEFDKKEAAFKFEQSLNQEKLLRSAQEATLSKQQLLLSNKEKDLQHLAYLAEKAEKQEKENLLSISEKEKLLQQAKLLEVSKEKEIQEKELALSQADLKSKNQQRNGFIIGSILLLLLAGTVFIGLQRTRKEKKISESLLLNILPAEVAEELKAKGSAEAKLIDEVTVLFTDFKGFTQLSEKLSPKELVAEINECFSAFDHIMQKHGVEKIKTIGDAYMAAGGLPTSNTTHANDVVLAALDIQQFMHEHKARKEAAGELFFEIRIGVHTGPVVAGIVGVKKFAYDIWGDTVNTASRMESSGEVGKVNISGTTYELVKDKFTCTHRGKVQAKGKGEIDMYFVEGRV